MVDVQRFHVDTGPAPLFERVRQVFATPRTLRTHGSHLADRLALYSSSRATIEWFDPAAWELITVEARVDTGKFVSTTWRRRIDRRDWWLVIGFNDTVRTFYPADPGKRGLGTDVVREGPLWEHVAKVNAELVNLHGTRDSVDLPSGRPPA